MQRRGGVAEVSDAGEDVLGEIADAAPAPWEQISGSEVEAGVRDALEELPPEQAEVPLLVKASVPVSIVPRGEYAQPDVFDTVLDLLSIESPDLDGRGSFVRLRPGAQLQAGGEP